MTDCPVPAPLVKTKSGPVRVIDEQPRGIAPFFSSELFGSGQQMRAPMLPLLGSVYREHIDEQDPVLNDQMQKAERIAPLAASRNQSGASPEPSCDLAAEPCVARMLPWGQRDELSADKAYDGFHVAGLFPTNQG